VLLSDARRLSRAHYDEAMSGICMSTENSKSELIKRFKNKTAVIGVVGLGYVGLPLVLRYVEMGYKVIGFDVDPEKVDKLNAGVTYIKHIDASRLSSAKDFGFEPTVDFHRATEVDALILCVPTPLDKHREPDLSFVVDTVDSLIPHLREHQVMSLESTTYPGTTDEELMPRIESRGFKVGENYFLVYSPEREDPGNANFTTNTIPKVCGGYSAACLEVGLALYGKVIDKLVPVTSTRAAEMTKLLENIHRAVNIGLVNEMKIVADRMGIDIHEVIRAAATKPFGFVPYYPGPGLGGHCIPIDPFYLTWKAREYGVATRFIELAGEVNSDMPDYVIAKVTDALNRRRKAVNGSSILVLGIAYKKNVDDMRESPSVILMEKLQALGADVNYNDPYVPVFPKLRDHAHFDLSSVDLTAENLQSYDCVLLATDHDEYDYSCILKNAQLIVDTRGRYLEPASNVVRS
jgi:UDP-N-acetyl-D-glucosamine dehydrogenase